MRVLLHSLLALSLLVSGALTAAQGVPHSCDEETMAMADGAHAHHAAAGEQAAQDCPCDTGACDAECQSSCSNAPAAPPVAAAVDNIPGMASGTGPRAIAPSAPLDELLRPPRPLSA